MEERTLVALLPAATAVPPVAAYMRLTQELRRALLEAGAEGASVTFHPDRAVVAVGGQEFELKSYPEDPAVCNIYAPSADGLVAAGSLHRRAPPPPPLASPRSLHPLLAQETSGAAPPGPHGGRAGEATL